MSTRISRLLAVAAASLCCGLAGATETGMTPDGIPYVIGGIGLEEAAQIEADSARHALALRTAARGSGAYLADVALTITDASGRVVFEHRLEGPWLLIDLKPGAYHLVGVRDGDVERLDVTVSAHGRRSAVMYFPVEGESRPPTPEERE